MTFSEAVKEEIIKELKNNHGLTKAESEEKSKKWLNRIEAEMWTTFDDEIKYLINMEDKNG